MLAPYVDSLQRGGSYIYGLSLTILAFGALIISVIASKIELGEKRLQFVPVLSTLLLIGTLLLIYLLRTVPILFLSLLIMGAAESIFNIVFSSILQLRIPTKYLGRVASIAGSIVRSAQPISSIAFGYFDEIYGFGSSIMMLVLFLIFSLFVITFSILTNQTKHKIKSKSKSKL